MPLTLEEAVLVLMLRQAGPSGDREPASERQARLGTIAQAVAEEAKDVEEAAELLATTYEEGQRWHSLVHSGKLRGDGGKAACLGQLHAHYVWFPRAEWQASMGAGLEATRVCIRGSARFLRYYEKCHRPWMGVEDRLARSFAGYGTGTTCDPRGRPWAYGRARRASRWKAELEALMAPTRGALA